MPLMVKEIINIMEDYAPLHLKESYDNVGLMIGDGESEVTKILIALDCTLKVIEEAIKCGCNLIITHHPLLFIKPTSITTNTLQGKKIMTLIKNNINLYSSHTNLDSTPNGINDIIMGLLDFHKVKILDVSALNSEAGIGRIAILEDSITLEELVNRVKLNLNIETIRYCGDESKIISKVAVINGSGQDYITMAINAGADCIITGDTTYHYISDYNEEGIAIIDAGHFDTEWPAMKAVADTINNRLEILGFNATILMSKATTNPYKFK
jgi:dinuclear metal center YbgI/SA1388 family protein